MAQNNIIILSDEKSDLVRSQIPSKPVLSSIKASIFPAKHKYDNEETPLKISSGNLHIKTRKLRKYESVGILDTEHFCMLPKTWLEYLQYEEVDVEITENLYNANYTPIIYLFEKDIESWDPKIQGPRNYLQSFYVAALVDECGTNIHYPLAMFSNVIYKKQDYLIRS